jgi:SH3 domain protein
MMRFVALVLMLVSTSVSAQSAWITDQLEVPIRSGESNQYRILRFLDSGTQIEVVSRNTSTGYSLIRDAQGRDGYVLTRYLEREPTASKRLETMQSELDQIRDDAANGAARIAQLRQQLATATDERNAARNALAATEAELSEIKRVSGDTLAIFEANKNLRAQLEILEDEAALLRSDNITLADDRDKMFMLIGAGLTLLGLVLGLILPNLRRRRRVDTW